jgi:hypothetical protein
MVSPQKKAITRVSHCEVIKLLFCLLGQAWIWTQVLTSLMSGAPLPSPGSVVHPRPSPWLARRINTPPDQAVLWCLVVSPPGGLVGCTLMTKEVITHQLHNPARNCCRSLLAEIQDSEANSRKKHFIVPTQTQWTHVQRLNPENKGVSPYIPFQADHRRKKQGLICIWLYLILLATLP